jgi:hypothetical protein
VKRPSIFFLEVFVEVLPDEMIRLAVVDVGVENGNGSRAKDEESHGEV